MEPDWFKNYKGLKNNILEKNKHIVELDKKIENLKHEITIEQFNQKKEGSTIAENRSLN